MKRIVTFERSPDGRRRAVVIAGPKKKRKKKKKAHRLLRPLERGYRQLAKANEKTATEFRKRHRRSRRKKKNAMHVRGPRDARKAMDKGMKKIRFIRF